MRSCVTLCVATATIAITAGQTQTAIANGDTRSLSIYFTHTREKLDITFKRNGRYDPEAIKKLSWLLRDWRRNEATKMDPRLFDIVWEVYRDVGATSRIVAVSGYRSAKTNNMLRSRSRGVAQFSQHTQGRAMDFYIPGVNVTKLREAGLRLQRGGVGFYPTANSPFVHMDAGSIRHWPRMTRQQLSQVFPDGRTVHMPTDGKPMANYALALADVQRGGGAVNTRYAQMAASGNNQRSRGFLSRLFGNDEEEDSEASSGGGDERYATLAPRRRPQDQIRAGRAPAGPAPVNTTPVEPIPLPVEAPATAAAPVAEPAIPATSPAADAPSAPVPVPAARPQEATPAPEPAMVEAPSMPVPRMAWNTGAAPAAGSTPTPASLPPVPAELPPVAVSEESTLVQAAALPMPRPANLGGAPALVAQNTPEQNLGTQVTAFAAEPQISLPMLRPQGLENHLQAPQALQINTPRTARSKPTPVAANGHTPRDYISRAYAASSLSTAALPAELTPIRLDAQVSSYMLSANRTINNGKDTLRHPNQHNLKTLMQVPNKALLTGFGSNPMEGLSIHSFKGSAVALLLSHSFITPDTMETTASIGRRR